MAATADGIQVVLPEQHTQQQHSTKTAANLDQHDWHDSHSGLLQRNVSSHDLSDQAAACRWSAAGLWALFVVGWILPPCWWVGVAVGLRGGKDSEFLMLKRKVLPMWFGRRSTAQAGECCGLDQTICTSQACFLRQYSMLCRKLCLHSVVRA
jgi:hypothetical protein